MKITLIHNPGAGYQQFSKERLIKSLQGEGIEIHYVSTKKDGFNENLLTHSADLFVVAGGDGTVKKIAHLLLGKQIPIAVIPLGTANNISTTLEPPILVKKNSQQWINLKTRPFDVGVVKFGEGKEFFVESAGCGAIAELIYQYRKEKKKSVPHFSNPQEEIRHVQSFMKEMLQNYQACHYEIHIDEETFSGEYLMVEVMNIKSVGPHLWLAPQADPGDGWMDVVLVHNDDTGALFAHLSVSEEDKKDLPHFSVKRGKKISITSQNTRFHIDDEVLPGPQQHPVKDKIHLDFHVENDCLRTFSNTFVLPEMK